MRCRRAGSCAVTEASLAGDFGGLGGDYRSGAVPAQTAPQSGKRAAGTARYSSQHYRPNDGVRGGYRKRFTTLYHGPFPGGHALHLKAVALATRRPERDTARAMSQQNVEVIRRAIEHLTETGELAPECFDPEVEYTTQPDGPNYTTY